ncbi:hypothetical protein KSP40_PGU019603 [Platanthera guangdongensis]|uniref:Uncharacterized protein n=1 Tax=Platanthera guangdongensis TaxID=2320717 RepID=A0ABR2M760_9ASPA
MDNGSTPVLEVLRASAVVERADGGTPEITLRGDPVVDLVKSGSGGGGASSTTALDFTHAGKASPSSNGERSWVDITRSGTSGSDLTTVGGGTLPRPACLSGACPGQAVVAADAALLEEMDDDAGSAPLLDDAALDAMEEISDPLAGGGDSATRMNAGAGVGMIDCTAIPGCDPVPANVSVLSTAGTNARGWPSSPRPAAGCRLDARQNAQLGAPPVTTSPSAPVP